MGNQLLAKAKGSTLCKEFQRTQHRVLWSPAGLPYRAGGQIIRYLTRYTHRVAITNRRILSVDEHAVRFRYRDYRDGCNKEMELSPLEFCRRFLQHVLPKGLSRIRHYGILSNRQRSRMLPEILFYFSRRPAKGKVFNVKAYLKKTYNKDLDKCPACKKRRSATIWSGILGADPRRSSWCAIYHQHSPLSHKLTIDPRGSTCIVCYELRSKGKHDHKTSIRHTISVLEHHEKSSATLYQAPQCTVYQPTSLNRKPIATY